MKLKAYRWMRGTRIEVFGDRAVDALIGNRPLDQWQREMFGRAGFEVEEVEDLATIPEKRFLLFHDNLFISPPLLKKVLRTFRRRLEAAPGTYRMALSKSAFTDFSLFTGEQSKIVDESGEEAHLYGLYFVEVEDLDSVLSALDSAVPVILDPWLKEVTIPFSSRVETMSDMRLPLTDLVAFELTSWVHLWQANIFSIGIRLVGLVRSPLTLFWVLWRVALGLLGAWSLRPMKLLTSVAASLTSRGRGCKIHPSAVVEASILGKGVEIGPLCVVRGSILGDGVQIMEQSIVDGSVLGDGVIVNQQAMIKVCVAYPKAVFAWMQTGLVGRRAFLGRLFRPLDMKFQGEVRVRHRQRIVNTGMPFLGCCIGHRAFVSATSVMLPGRVIPNDYKVLSDTSAYIDKVPDDLPTDWLLLAKNGTIEPLAPAKVKRRNATEEADGGGRKTPSSRAKTATPSPDA